MGHHSKPQQPEYSTKEKLKQIKKERKLKLKEKRARLIVRNLPFKVTDDSLREHFAKYGDIVNIEILKKDDGKLVGCAFIQFKLVQKAAKAQYHTNDKPFLGRNIQVDFALAKNAFKKAAVKNEVKEESEVKVKDEPIDVDELDNTVKENEDVKTVDNDDDDDDDDVKSTKSGLDEDNDDIEEEEEIEEPERKPRVESNDVSEGKTIFVKNVPFQATNQDLKECMWQFGSVYYALVCVDKFTEHSKGTAFVKFQNIEDAEKALSAGTELTLLGNILDCHKALGRNEVMNKTQKEKNEDKGPKDSRNLYLVKEGVIMAGSKSAEGVSASDMAKRLQLEQYKTQMLRNLNMFVSRDRIVIHNLPPSWDDKKLFALVKKFAPKNAVIREAKVMRDNKNVDEKGVGLSKELGFVAFTKHEDAITALRNLNNNPTIFAPHKRPIVAFSIENRSMLKAKQKRLEKSKLKNPICKDFDPNVKKIDDEKRRKYQEIEEEGEREKFVGVAAKPGVGKMRSRFNLKTQARLHHENLKQEKKNKKSEKKTFKERQKDFTKQPRQKVNQKKETDNFSKLVSDYKKKLMDVPAAKKAKWYDGET